MYRELTNRWNLNVIEDGAASTNNFMSLQTHHEICCDSFKSSQICQSFNVNWGRFICKHGNLNVIADLCTLRICNFTSFQTQPGNFGVVCSHHGIEQVSWGLFEFIQGSCSLEAVIVHHSRHTMPSCTVVSSRLNNCKALVRQIFVLVPFLFFPHFILCSVNCWDSLRHYGHVRWGFVACKEMCHMYCFKPIRGCIVSTRYSDQCMARSLRFTTNIVVDVLKVICPLLFIVQKSCIRWSQSMQTSNSTVWIGETFVNFTLGHFDFQILTLWYLTIHIGALTERKP